MEDGLVPNIDDSLLMSIYVLILVVVEDGLVRVQTMKYLSAS